MPISDYNKKKPLEVSSINDSGTTQDKAQPIIIIGGDDSTTGTGDIVIDFTNIANAQDIAVYDQKGNLLDYEIESLDTAAETGVIWAYDSWVRDDTVQAQVAYGNNSANVDRSVAGTGSNPWENGQNAVMVQHFQDDPLTATDSTSNNNDGTVTGAVSTTGEFDGAASFDGSDDIIDLKTLSSPLDGEFTIVTWFERNSSDDGNNDRLYEIRAPGGGDEIIVRSQTNNFNNNLEVFFSGAKEFSSDKVPDGEFVQTAFTWDGSDTANLFLNASSTLSISRQSTDGAERLAIGGTFSQGELFSGTQDEFKIFLEKKSTNWLQAELDASPKAGQVYFSQQAADTTSTTVKASPTLATGTPTTAQTTGILGNWRAFKDARITERTQVKVEGGHAQKWEIDASKTTDERAVYRADQTLDLDLSTALGTASGGFSQGTIGWHIRIDDTAILRSTDALQLRVGSSPGDYAVWTLDRSELGPEGEYKYLTFSHDEYDSIVGTPDWTNADFFELTVFESSGNTTDTFIYVDYLTVSDRDDVGATGIGDRRSDKEQIRSGD